MNAWRAAGTPLFEEVLVVGSKSKQGSADSVKDALAERGGEPSGSCSGERDRTRGMQVTWKSPVILIGMDAATWDVMDPLLASGRLPNTAHLMREGTSGRLRSIIRYVSPALWTSIITGRLPEKHGVLDFYRATRLHIRCATIDDILGTASGRVGFFRWFATWPPVQNAGFTVPSAIARSPETHPPELSFLNELVHPSGLKSYLTGGLRLARHGARLSTIAKALAELAYEVLARPERLDWWCRRRLVEAAIYGDVFTDLLRRYRPLFAAVLLFHTDDFGHRYWKYRQPELFEDVTAEELRKYGHVIDEGYIASDEVIGRILQSIPQDALVVVLSDHGQQAGPFIKAPYRMSPDLLKRLGFDGRVWMTYIGYRSSLRPRSGEDRRQILQELHQALQQVVLSEGARPVFEVSAEDPLQLVAKVSLGPKTRLDLGALLPGNRRVQLGDILYTDGRISGAHSEWGVLIMRGPGVRKRHRIEGASILDVAPTILALRNKPVARDMDGQVVLDAIEQSFLKKNPVDYVESYETEKPVEEVMPYTDMDLEKLQVRLRALGYLA